MHSIQKRLYRKIWSANPDQYKSIEAEGVITGYYKYLVNCAVQGYDLRKVKTIKEWLDTEI